MSDAAPEVSKEEHRALWMEVLRWPLKGGMLGGVIVLTALAFASAQLEGGASQSAREQRAMGQGVVGLAALLVLGVYSWRAVSCTYPAERPVPWGGDPDDATPVGQRATTFLAAFVVSFLLLLAWITLRGPVGAAPWVDWLVIATTSAIGAALLPLGLAGSIAQRSVLGAMPTRVWRMWRADSHGARIAMTTALAFVGLLVLSAWMAAVFVKQPSDSQMPSDVVRGDPDMVGPVLRYALFALRAAGFYAALVSFRVGGLLVREVPQMREVVA